MTRIISIRLALAILLPVLFLAALYTIGEYLSK